MWQSIFKAIPPNGSTVWIRVLNIYGELAIAKVDYATQSFTVLATGINIPAYMVARWKPYP